MSPRFVIHEHGARTHHFDFRLEKEGVLKSWAVPKGIPTAPGEKSLAIEVVDHPLAYRNFEGVIPAGEYGAGTVRIWDEGTYGLRHWDGRKIAVTLQGRRVNGNYTLIKFSQGDPRHWLLLKNRQAS